jgi:hypothetical protein
MTPPPNPPPPPPPKKNKKGAKKERAPEETEPKEVSTRPNKCPPRGTEAANVRTILASLSRCKTAERRRDFLASKGMTEEDLVAMQQKKSSTKVEKKVRKRKPKRKVATEGNGPSGTPTNASNAIQGAPHQPPLLPFLIEALRAEIGSPSTQEAQTERDEIQVKETVLYYCGPGRPHLFCVIVRVADLEEDKDRSAPHDYDCVLTMRHTDLNGSGALQLTKEMLSAIRHNCGSLRCELQNGVNLRNQENVDSPLLKSIIATTSISTTLKEPDFLPRDWLDFERYGMSPRNTWLITELDNPTFIIDITDITRPKYCFLAHHNGVVQTLAHSPLNDIDMGQTEVWRYTHAMAEWQLVKIHAVLSTWPFLSQRQVSPLPLMENGFEEFWERVSAGVSYAQKWPIPELSSAYLDQSLASESGRADLFKMLQTPNKGYYVDRHNIYLPFACPYISDRILRFTDPVDKVHILTLAGCDRHARFTVFSHPRPSLVFLNLMYCQISNDELARILQIDTLDTFIHESTILPGIECNNLTERTRKSLKVLITYIESDDESLDDPNTIHEYLITEDESNLRELNPGCRVTKYALEHPFMGALSALTCLQTLFDRLPLNHSSGRELLATSILRGIFSRGYKPELKVGLPVALDSQYSTDNDKVGERYPGTALKVACYQSRMYACFDQWIFKGDAQPQWVLESMTPRAFLAQYKNFFGGNIGGDVLGICEELERWCSDDGYVVGN